MTWQKKMKLHDIKGFPFFPSAFGSKIYFKTIFLLVKGGKVNFPYCKIVIIYRGLKEYVE